MSIYRVENVRRHPLERICKQIWNIWSWLKVYCCVGWKWWWENSVPYSCYELKNKPHCISWCHALFAQTTHTHTNQKLYYVVCRQRRIQEIEKINGIRTKHGSSTFRNVLFGVIITNQISQFTSMLPFSCEKK